MVNKKRKFILFLIMFIFCVGLTGQSACAKESEKLVVEYYYYSSCDGCSEGEVFEMDLRTKVSDVVEADDFEVILKDLGDSKWYDEFMEIVEKKQTEDFYPMAPLLKIGDNYMFGIDEIESHSRAILIEKTGADKDDVEAVVNSLRGINQDDSFFVYFYVPGCTDCEKVQGYFETLNKSFMIDNKESNLKMVYINMGRIENIPLSQWFFEKYGVEKKDQKAPAVFYQNGYLQGFEDIKNGMHGVIENGAAKEWQDIDYTPQKEESKFAAADWALLLVTGLVNGINPCGLSILLLLLSLLLAKKENIFKLGMSFIAAKFITYLLFGTVLSSVISQLSSMIAPVEKVLKIIIAFAAVLFAVMNFRDAYLAKKEEYGKIKMQLPKGLRKFNNEYVENIISNGKKSLTALAFLAGIVVSAGEFLCTGQLYLTSIIYAMEKSGENSRMMFAVFAAYLVCMCIPLVLITILVSKSTGVLQISEFARKNMKATKIIYGIVFVLFAVLILIL